MLVQLSAGGGNLLLGATSFTDRAIKLVQQDDIKGAIQILDSALAAGVRDELTYHFLVNCYMQSNNRKMAVATCDSALAYFPNSARIYCELGYLDRGDGNPIQAVVRWEYGVKCDPTYPDNYIPLIDNNYEQNDRLWSAFYGEIFLNTSSTERNIETVSGRIYDAIFSSLAACDSSIDNFRFSSARTSYIPGQVDSSKYSFTFAASLQLIHAYHHLCGDNFTRSLASLVALWREFDAAWYRSIYATKWKNPVIEYHHELIEAGLFEPYCYLLYRMGDTKEFEKYARNNADKLQKLAKYMSVSPMKLGEGYNVSKVYGY